MPRSRIDRQDGIPEAHRRETSSHPAPSDDARRQLLAHIPAREQRLVLAGIPTALLEGGSGPPVILLHDPGGHAAKWMRVLPQLMATHRVVAPDLPGHGASELPVGPLDAQRVLSWLGELIEQTCATPPAVVGLVLGGAIAARFALHHPDRVSHLVMVDSLGLQPFQPARDFGLALNAFLSQPTADAHDHLWRYCAFDLDALRKRMGEAWEPFAAYNLECARSPRVQAALHALMEQFGLPAIPTMDLARIAVPTTLIWGRHDLATPLQVAEVARARFGWPLRVIENCADDPPIEQPEAFLEAMRAAIRRAPEPAVTL